ncbi:fimbrial protein [Bordetella avium]|uniref:fimbrial protein n=1 Tax=Bordetella avium TaxID=521 RepID=UPI000FDC5273|nr:fimbrial protein [Bordetella avium]AZY51349.1 fimbrial protein [Bordetella avium]
MWQSAIRNPQSAIECVKTTALTLLALGGIAAAPAHAADGLITITGEITAQTCKINGQTPPYNLLVALPKISTSALKNTGDTAGSTVFQLKLSDCPEALANQSLSAYFEAGPTVDYATGNLLAYKTNALPTEAASSLPNTGLGSSDVFSDMEIQLANTDGSAIKIGSPAAEQNSKGVTAAKVNSTASATLTYLARYIKTGTGAIGAGKVQTYVQYSIVYP